MPPITSGAEIISTRRLRLLTGAIIALGALSCDDTFSPIEPSQLAFSIFGHLDAAADTQWIRVMPLRPVLVTTPEPLGFRVTLEQMATGQTVVLRDSAFRFTGHNQDVGSEGVFLHNFWTTQTIEPGATYHFSVEGDGGARAEATIKVSPEYGVEVWYRQVPGGRDQLRLSGLNYGAMIMITHFEDTCGAASWRQPLTSGSTQTDTLAMTIVPITPRRESCGSPQILKREMLVIGSGSAWPEGAEHSTWALGAGNGDSNIANAIGFLGGVLTRMVPYENCQIEQGLAIEPKPYCVLRYNESSVTLTGTVTDVVCREPVGGATIRVRELDPDPLEGRKLRLAATTGGGRFEITALEAGQRYEISIRKLDSERSDLYRAYTDTLQFSPGQVVTHDVELIPLLPCTGR